MLAAVDLDDQSFLEAEEVNDILVDGCLPPELHSIELAKSKARPDPTLGIGQLFTELAGDGHSHAGQLRYRGKRRHPHPDPPPSRGGGRRAGNAPRCPT